jgi:hypothetical protein
MKQVFCLLLIFFVSCVLSQNFKADFVKSGGVIKGNILGTLYYSTDYLATKWVFKQGFVEVEKFDPNKPNEQFLYKRCSSSSCKVVPKDKTLPLPIFYTTSCNSPKAVSTPYGTCQACAVSDYLVSSICVSSTSTLNKVKRITFKDGTYVDFPSEATTDSGGVSSADFDVSSWGCVLNCYNPLDIVMVNDESDSIYGNYFPGADSSWEWMQQRSFVMNFVSKFSISSDKVQMGFVQFAKGARKIISTAPHITSNAATVNTIASGLTKNLCGVSGADPAKWYNYQDCRGWTYMGSGVLKATSILLDPSRSYRAGVGKVIVLVTDGGDNYPNSYYTYNGKTLSNSYTAGSPTAWASFIQSQGIKLVTVGVGSGVNEQYLKDIASKDSKGKPLFFLVSSFNSLSSVEFITSLGDLVCTASGTSNDCSTACAGLCVCGSCKCPDNCDDYNACTDGTCSASVNDHGGCRFTPTNCDDGNKCTRDTCDTNTGCKHVDISSSCDDGLFCTVDSCDPKIGCQHKPLDCSPQNACYVRSCSEAASGCTTETVKDCSSGDACILDNCYPTAGGCVHTQKVNVPTVVGGCNDGINCTDDQCSGGTCSNPTSSKPGCNNCVVLNCATKLSADKCTMNQVCDEVANACVDVPVNCDDGNACTEDKCVPGQGCVYTPLNCTSPCKIASCDPKLGCQYTDVVCDDGNLCSNDYCDPATSKCVYEPVVCDDGDACTQNLCDPLTGCNYSTPVDCEDGSICTINSCDSAIGCINNTVTCDQLKPNITSICQEAVCDDIQGCMIKEITCVASQNGSKIDNCFIAVCNEQTGCTNEKSDICKIRENIALAVGLSGGFIALIVIASVIALVGGAFGGKKLYDAIQHAREADFNEENVNPDFKQPSSTLQSDNTLYVSGNLNAE